MANQAIKDIIRDLGAYYGIRGADAYLASLLGEKTDTPWPVDQATREAFSRGVFLNAICALGDTSTPTVQALINYAKEVGEPFDEDIAITPNDASGPDEGPLNKLTSASGFQDQGLGKPTMGDYYCIDDIRIYQNEGGTPVNVIQVFPGVSNVQTADTDVASLFLNSIPPLEMSRAVPYLDITVLGQADDDPEKTRAMSLGRWLMGPENTDGDVGNAIANSEDVTLNPVDTFEDGEKKTAYRTLSNMEIFTSPVTLVNAERYYNTQGKNLGGIHNEDPFRPFMSIESFKVNVQGAGIGMFSFKTADLSLVLHDRQRMKEVGPLVSPRQTSASRFVITYGWSHPDGLGRYGNLRGSRASDASTNRFGELIDAMRVTETYQVYTSDFSFESDGSVKIDLRLGLLGAENIDKIDVTLPKVASMYKDLSNMFDQIKDAVKSYKDNAGQLGDVEMPQHIEQVSNMNSAQNIKTKEFKELLKSLRGRNKNSDLSTVEKLTTRLLGEDGEGGLLADFENTKARAIAEMVDELAVTPDPFLRPGFSDVYDPLAFDRRGYEQSKKKRGRNRRANPDSLVFWGNGRDNDGFTGVSAAMVWKMAMATGKSVEEIIEEQELELAPTRHRLASFGKIVAKFAADALAREGIYEEIQLVFHPVNESAGHFHGQNLASFPIHLDDFKKVLTKQFSQTGTMTIKQFMGMLARFFIRDPGNSAFGFAAAFGERDPEKGLSRKKIMVKNAKKSQKKKGKKGKKSDKKDTHPLLDDIRMTMLKTAYLGSESYSKDKSAEGNIRFKMPSVSAKIHTMPARNAVVETMENGPIPSKTILKMHIYDDSANNMETLQDTFIAFAQTGVVNKMIRKIPSYYGAGKIRHARTEDLIANQFKALIDRGILMPAADVVDGEKLSEGGHSKAALDEMAFGMYVVAPGTLADMKSTIFKMSPAIIWGSMAGGLIEGKFKSMQSGGLQTVMMLRQADGEDGSDGSDGLPMQVSPTSVSLETMGCPYLGFTQQYFIDFGTNTTADNFYAVMSVTHNLSPGEFKTSVDMISMQAYGKLRAPKSELIKTVMATHQAKKKSS